MILKLFRMLQKSVEKRSDTKHVKQVFDSIDIYISKQNPN